MQTDFSTNSAKSMNVVPSMKNYLAPPPGFEGIQPNKKGYNTGPISLLTLSTLSTRPKLPKQFIRPTQPTEPISPPPQPPTEFHPVFPTLSLQAVNLLEDVYPIPTQTESNVYRRTRIGEDWWQIEM